MHNFTFRSAGYPYHETIFGRVAGGAASPGMVRTGDVSGIENTGGGHDFQ